MWVAFATNTRTKEVVCLGFFDFADVAWDNIKNNLIWDPEDIPEEWEFDVKWIEGDDD